MQPTVFSSELDRFCSARPARVYGIVADLTRLPDWWLWNHPHPRLELDEYDVADLTGAGTAAAEGVTVEVRATGGAGTIRGKRHTWGARTARYSCALAAPNERLKLTVTPGPDDADNSVRELEVVITPEGTGSRIALRRLSESNVRGPRRALARRIHKRGWGLERPLKRLVALAEATP
jgi:hypothetical protein